MIGVQVATCAPFPASLAAGEPVAVDSALTIADGIAVKRPGELTLPLIKRWVDEVVVVEEDDVGEAMVFLLERAKLVVEGAGAVGVAALLAGSAALPASGTTVVILSGGNVDAGLLGADRPPPREPGGAAARAAGARPGPPGLAGAAARAGRRAGRQPARRDPHPRGARPARPRDRGAAGARDARARRTPSRCSDAVRGAGYGEPRVLR